MIILLFVNKLTAILRSDSNNLITSESVVVQADKVLSSAEL